MHTSRRTFIGSSITMLAAASLGAAQQETQVPLPKPMPPFPNPQGQEPLELPPVPKPNRAVLKANRETIAKDVTRMADLVEQLQKALDANSTTEVLSLDVLRKSEEIEKLARQVRELVKA